MGRETRAQQEGSMPIVRFVKQNREVECTPGTDLRKLCLEHEIDLYSIPTNLLSCRGNGFCGTCRVMVSDPRALTQPTPTEESKVTWEGPNFRLACQCEVRADVDVVTNPRRRQGWTGHQTYKWMEDLPY
jgi:ferredoxin